MLRPKAFRRKSLPNLRFSNMRYNGAEAYRADWFFRLEDSEAPLLRLTMRPPFVGGATMVSLGTTKSMSLQGVSVTGRGW